MSIFGKVLAVFNVLAAGAFVFLATQARGTQHAWKYTAMRHEMALDGLPLNQEEKDADGEPLAQKLTDNTMQQILPDGPVRTLEEEVQGRKRDINQGTLESLLLTARTGGERDELRELIRDGKQAEVIERAFSDALNPQLNADARRQAIAFLLIALAEVPSDLQKTESNLRRVYNLVGVRDYTRAMEEHARNLRGMGSRVREGIAQDRGDFVLQHDMLVRHLVLTAEHIEDLKRQRQHLTDQKVENHQALDVARKKDLADLDAEFKIVDKERADEQARQTDLEKKLFAVQRRLGEANEKNVQLERAIRKLEVGR